VDEVTIEGPGGTSLSGLWSGAADPVAVAAVAHGAGAGMAHPVLAGIASGLAANSVSCLRFNFPYAEAGRRSPDRPPALLTAWRAALAEAERRADGLPVVAGGKSLGGRMASVLAAEEGERSPAKALVFFGYPLHPPGKPEKLRDSHLFDITIPMLFIQGTADALARFDLVQDVVARLGPAATLHVVEGGDHSFRVRGARRPDEEMGGEIGAVAAEFIAKVVG
jgi:predicted alpha/beta-hydrolase family hydrolase